MAAPITPRRGAGRPAGMPNRRTAAIGATLDAAHARVTRALLDEVIPDRQLAQLLWKLALEGDGRVATYLADRKWGRVKFELEHEGSGEIVLTLGGGPSHLEYEPLGVVPGMEQLMPRGCRVKLLPAKATHVEPQDEAKAAGNGNGAPKPPHDN